MNVLNSLLQKKKVDEWEQSVSDFSWEVEFVRNEFDLGELYCHIAYTPTAQDFVQEMECLWQEKKKDFHAFVEPLVHLFYSNRIIEMTDDGVLISVTKELER